MLNGSFREAGSTYLRLKDVDAATFHVFYYWLNSGVVDYTNGDPSTAADRIWQNAIDAYIFADFHQAQVFKNAFLDSLYLYYEKNNLMCVSITGTLYANTVAHDAMRNFIVCIAAGTLSFKSVQMHGGAELCEKAFLFDVILASQERILVPAVDAGLWLADMRKNFCEHYHTHKKTGIS